jgi:hypothetical protein
MPTEYHTAYSLQNPAGYLGKTQSPSSLALTGKTLANRKRDQVRGTVSEIVRYD